MEAPQGPHPQRGPPRKTTPCEEFLLLGFKHLLLVPTSGFRSILSAQTLKHKKEKHLRPNFRPPEPPGGRNAPVYAGMASRQSASVCSYRRCVVACHRRWHFARTPPPPQSFAPRLERLILVAFSSKLVVSRRKGHIERQSFNKNQGTTEGIAFPEEAQNPDIWRRRGAGRLNA